jgi:Ser/Thr protein kinase RdoA (MazF antagonist)
MYGATSNLKSSSAANSLQPIIYSTLSMEGVKELVHRHYDLDGPLECTFVSRSVSDTYRLSTPGRRFALKVYRTNWRTREDIGWEIATLAHMNARGVEVAMPVPRRDGDLITAVCAPEGPRSAVLFHWARGHAPKYTNAEHALQYGRLLGKLHTAGDGVPPNTLRPPMDMTYLLEKPLVSIRTRSSDLPAVSLKLAGLEGRIRARAQQAERELRDDWGFCHGDVWTNNARIDGQHIVLFDFDFAGSGWHVFDLASYRWDARRKGLEAIAWQPFIEGYLQIRPNEANSLKFIGLFMILKSLWTASLFIERSPETGTNFLSDEDLEDLVPFCENIEASTE